MKHLICSVLGAALLCAAGLMAGSAAAAAPPQQQLVWFDNDFLGPAGSNIQSLIPLLRQPSVKLLGIGVVTGDAWLKEEVQHTLRFLEIAGVKVPVQPGAVMPLIRTQAEMRQWEAQYGPVPWKGAWNNAKPGEPWHPDDPELVPPLPEGAPTTTASAENAANAIIRVVHEHPGQVILVAAGPLTNFALALRMDPQVATLAKEIVIQGGYLDDAIARVAVDADYGTDFNFIFDPQAAHIVLTAPWKRVTLVGDVTTPVKMTKQIADKIGASGSAVGRYVQKFTTIGQPFWDEITAAVAVDRTLVKQELVMRMDVDLLPGPFYGMAQVWNEQQAPHKGEVQVHLVRRIDVPRFLDTFVAEASK